MPLRDNDRSRERRRGYFAALKELGLPADPGLVLEAPGGFAEGADALVRLVQTYPDIDACFFAGDVLAVGALFECQRRGWAVHAASPSPASTTSATSCATPCGRDDARIPRQDIGRRSAELLVNRLRGASPQKAQDRCRL